MVLRNLSSPKNSPLLFLASVIPSVYKVILSPGDKVISSSTIGESLKTPKSNPGLQFK